MASPYDWIFGGQWGGPYSPSNPAPYGQGMGVLKPEFGGGVFKQGTANVAPSGSRDVNNRPSGPTGPSAADLAAQAQARANAIARARSRRENENTRALADQQFGLISAFKTARGKKLGNLDKAFGENDQLLLSNYAQAVQGLDTQRGANDAAEAGGSYSNIVNAIRERQSIGDQVRGQGAGETDLLRAQLQALRNYSANQSEISRAYNDTQTSINSALGGLNRDTASSRTNLFNQREADRQSVYANASDQIADAWTQIMNIENSNTNVDSESSEGYDKKYGQAGKEAANAADDVYTRLALPKGWTDWGGKSRGENRELTSNKAAAINLGQKTKRPEGATLRRWDTAEA